MCVCVCVCVYSYCNSFCVLFLFVFFFHFIFISLALNQFLLLLNFGHLMFLDRQAFFWCRRKGYSRPVLHWIAPCNFRWNILDKYLRARSVCLRHFRWSWTTVWRIVMWTSSHLFAMNGLISTKLCADGGSFEILTYTPHYTTRNGGFVVFMIFSKCISQIQNRCAKRCLSFSFIRFSNEFSFPVHMRMIQKLFSLEIDSVGCWLFFFHLFTHERFNQTMFINVDVLLSNVYINFRCCNWYITKLRDRERERGRLNKTQKLKIWLMQKNKWAEHSTGVRNDQRIEIFCANIS